MRRKFGSAQANKAVKCDQMRLRLVETLGRAQQRNRRLEKAFRKN